MISRSDLKFDYPEDLVATEPARPTRVLYVEQPLAEISISQLLQKFSPGDALVINDTQVLRRRLFANSPNTSAKSTKNASDAKPFEIVFLQPLSDSSLQNLNLLDVNFPNPENAPPTQYWQVLFPCQKMKVGESLELPGGLRMDLVSKGLPQVVKVHGELDFAYFQEFGELPLPPYIQRARGERHNRQLDDKWYQSAWGVSPGSLAAPTASLHFSAEDLETLRSRGVKVLPLTLHVGLGTFLPLQSEDLAGHEMHSEFIEIPKSTAFALEEVRRNKKKIWALGTTATRSLESLAAGLLTETPSAFVGESKLFIYPPYQFHYVDRLLTNFHQPESTLLALVFAFAGADQVRTAYQFAIAQRMRLFSYGDLSVWSRE